jgi:hypothetical protein
LGNLPDLDAEVHVQIVKADRMPAGNDKEVSGCDRLHVHERDDLTVVVDDAGGGLAVDDGAEDAPVAWHSCVPFPSLIRGN